MGALKESYESTTRDIPPWQYMSLSHKAVDTLP